MYLFSGEKVFLQQNTINLSEVNNTKLYSVLQNMYMSIKTLYLNENERYTFEHFWSYLKKCQDFRSFLNLNRMLNQKYCFLSILDLRSNSKKNKSILRFTIQKINF